jgi:cysteinyl-tRNA synthetase
MSKLVIYNTLSREKQPFEPLDPSHVRIYACGPTVYNYAHIGNARMAVIFDLLARLLRHLYPKVTYVSNITDIEDKIIKAAEETGEGIGAITKKYADIYNSDMSELGVKPPDFQPRATAHINDMLEIIGKLIDAGHAYEAEGHVLFNVPSFEKYGGLSGRSRDDQVAGARVEVAPYKKDPADFILWKPSSDDQPGWDSPWGRGRPGWHIECSAMAEKLLGLPFDIHGGGADLKFPHHENEIAQSCCAHGKEDDLSAFAKYWVHNGFVTVESEKMAKSVGNIILAHDLIKTVPGEAIRYNLISGHYRQPLDWTEDGLAQSKKTLDRMYQHLRDLEDVPEPDNRKPPQEVVDALCDDLNTPKALSALNSLVKSSTEAKSFEERQRIKGQILAAGELLGLLSNNPEVWLGYGQAGDGEDIDVERIEKLLEERRQARREKNFARADEIRDTLAAEGIVIEDTPQGPQWKKQ